ncbi:unnamed protein product [Rotaria sp. Silwood2]|nr:unnamed protein product [Rotaria sp. Silwood2]CAF4692696.1 unnamed protein product [Rotaria sp. Silwood2]
MMKSIASMPSSSSDLVGNAYSCSYNPKPALKMGEAFVAWFNPVGSSFLHFIANILVLISITRRKVFLSQGRQSQLTMSHSLYQQIVNHSEYFLPPFVILLCQLTNLIAFQVALKLGCVEAKFGTWTHVHLLCSFIIYVPQSLTFVLFVYPSKNYMKIFWKESIVGHWIEESKTFYA